MWASLAMMSAWGAEKSLRRVERCHFLRRSQPCSRRVCTNGTDWTLQVVSARWK